MPTSHLLLAVACGVLFDVIVLTVWMVRAPYTIASQWQRECVSEEDHIFLPILLSTKGALLLFGVYLTWRTWNIPTAYNESRWIAVCIYGIGTLGVIAILRLYTADISPATALGVCSLCLSAGVFLTLGFLVGPKVRLLVNKKNAYKAFNVTLSTEPSVGGKLSNAGRGRSQTTLNSPHRDAAGQQQELMSPPSVAWTAPAAQNDLTHEPAKLEQMLQAKLRRLENLKKNMVELEERLRAAELEVTAVQWELEYAKSLGADKTAA